MTRLDRDPFGRLARELAERYSVPTFLDQAALSALVNLVDFVRETPEFLSDHNGRRTQCQREEEIISFLNNHPGCDFRVILGEDGRPA